MNKYLLVILAVFGAYARPASAADIPLFTVRAAEPPHREGQRWYGHHEGRFGWWEWEHGRWRRWEHRHERRW
jgi:hypothetical protein